jgi:DNA-binding MarR family transcriptional regulator
VHFVQSLDRLREVLERRRAVNEVDPILRGPAETVTAGWLSDMTGLTTGAITHILDRLEKRQIIERVRDTQDRRKIFIRVRPESLQPLAPRYEAIGKSFLSLAEQYDDDELRLICNYLERTSEVSERELAKVIAANQAHSSQAKSTKAPRQGQINPRRRRSQ